MQDTVTFQDIFKKSFLKLMPTTIDPFTLVMTLLLALVIGLGIFAVYRKYFIGVVYDHAFNLSLVIMTVLTSLIIVTISSNVALSLGMVGALSIIRYRTAVKNPLDLMFMFWAITTGIAVGAQYYFVGLASFPLVTAIFVILYRFRGATKTYVLVVNYDSDIRLEEEIRRALKDVKSKLRSKVVKNGVTELTAELHLKTDNFNITDRLSGMKGVHDVTLVQYRGTYE